MSQGRLFVVLAVFGLLLVGSPASAQTSSISGVVVDTAGGVVPGATVTAKNNATNVAFEAISTGAGAFSIPAVPIGTYTVTVTLEGFKTVELNDVVVNAGVPAAVNATLEVGAVAEMITVQAMSEIVQSQTTAVSTTLNVRQIVNLPLSSRASLDFVRFLPGVNSPGGTRDSTINGLPQSAINITLDGVNVQDNTLKTGDGFFAIVNPRLDAIEEVTMSSAAQGAEGSGQGAVQIRFVTRSGTNQYQGSLYHYYRNDSLNTNTWFNVRDDIDKANLLQNQWGGRVGGPLSIPGLFDGRDRAFFFVNYEEFRQPSDLTRNRTVLYPSAETGVFRYSTTAGIREVNLLSLAAANGHLATTDPTTAKLLADIRAATGTTGTITDLADPLFQRYSFNVAQQAKRQYPTMRIDANVSARHRASFVVNYQNFADTPDTLNNRDPFFPGFPITATQGSERLAISTSVRSTLGSNLVNEARYGLSSAPVTFFKELTPDMWGGTSVANQDGFHLNLAGTAPQNLGITNAGNTPVPQSRNASTWVVEDTVNWLKGAHSLSFGGTFTRVSLWMENQTLVPTVNFGIVTGDPADSMFTATNFPGASTTNLNNARALYALLVGRVSSITGNARIDEGTGKYAYMGAATQRGEQDVFATFLQDSWRLRPDLTFNLGLRYEILMPFKAGNASYSYATMDDAWGVSGNVSGCDPSNVTPEKCNIFKPGTLTGTSPTFKQLEQGVEAYGTDYNNIAPSVGLSWTPSADTGFFRKFLGQPGDTVIRGGFARSFNRNGMSDFTDRFGSNPGILITANRDISLGNLGTLPVLFRNKNVMGPPAFASEPVYPMTDVITGDVNVFDPNLQTPRVDSWSAGLQRAVSQNMAVEVRYVGTRSRALWTNYNYNETNILENGFLDEFRLAQQNLQANVAAGRGNNFRYYGPGTGTSPLPIYLAFFSGIPASRAGDASLYTSSNFASSTYYNHLAKMNPVPFTAAGTGTSGLMGSATFRANARTAGLPSNFFLANPDLLGGAIVTGNGGYTNYNSLQMELRRRMSQGLQFQMSYAYGKAYESQFYSFRRDRLEQLDSGGEGGVMHAFKANWVWELPFGRGRKFGGNVNGAVDRLIGGWQIHGVAQFQTGRLIDFGNVRMVGFDLKELQDMYQLRKTADSTGKLRVYMLPQAVIDETVKAFSVSATSPTGYGALGAPSGKYFAPANGPDCIETAMSNSGNQTTGYGDCGERSLVVTGPMFKQVDLSVAKMIPIVGRTRLEFRVEMLNVFDWVNFVPVAGIGASGINANNFEVTTLNSLVGNYGRVVQIVSRFSW
jgi:hypothetical protein